MPELFAVDTNLYIGALRDPAVALALRRFLVHAGPRIRLHAVVVLELRAGARTLQHRAAVTALLSAYTRRERFVTPSFEAYEQAGRVIADLAEKERFDAHATPSIVQDILLATSCREAGVTLVTANHADFTRIGRHLRGFRAVPPWPGA